MNNNKVFVICLSVITMLFASEPGKDRFESLIPLQNNAQSPNYILKNYFDVRQSPGDEIGTTWYDFQAGGSFGQRIDVDDLRQAHIVWTFTDAGQTNRHCAWNLRYDNGLYYGEIQAAPYGSGYVQMDITRDLAPEGQRTVIAYNYEYGVCIDIDAGNAWGAFPYDPSCIQVAGHIWPYVAVANNNNIVLATGNYAADSHHLYLTTDEGNTWSYIMGFDSCPVLSQFIRASEKRDTNKVAFVHTQYITDSVAAGQLDNDVYYRLSEDGGLNWGPHINITNYQPYPEDSVRAYCGVNAVFDGDDNLHVAWAGMKVDSINYYPISKIFHWDELHDTITIVNSPSIYYNEPGGWWIQGSLGQFGGFRLPADQPQLVYDTTNNYLYCLWHGNDDTTDVSAAGYFNGELYGAYSTDGGITWSDYVNLTNTRTPGCGPGQCCDEDYMTACPRVVADSIFVTYIEDKDAGAWPMGEGTLTENIVRCWVFPTLLITGIEEHHVKESSALSLHITPNPFTTHCVIKLQTPNSKFPSALRVYDAGGRAVKSITPLPDYQITWHGNDQQGDKLAAGVYFIEFKTGDKIITKKVIKLK